MRIRSNKDSIVTATYSTTDSPDKVLDFYRSKLNGNVSLIQNETGAILTSGEHGKESWMITVSSDGLNGAKTKIAIMHAKKS